MEFFYGAMVTMCSTTWAGVLPHISARGHCALGGITLVRGEMWIFNLQG